MSTRRLILSQELGGGDDIFPMYLYLTQIDDEEYRLDPTPESIALFDYFLENAVYDGAASFDLRIEPGLLYIDDLNVTIMTAVSYDGVTPSISDVGWASTKKYFFLESREIYWYDGYEYPKGTIRVIDDD